MKSKRSLSIPEHLISIQRSDQYIKNFSKKNSIIFKNTLERNAMIYRLRSENIVLKEKLKNLNSKLNKYIDQSRDIINDNQELSEIGLKNAIKDLNYYKSEYEELKKQTKLLKDKSCGDNLIKDIRTKEKVVDLLINNIKNIKRIYRQKLNDRGEHQNDDIKILKYNKEFEEYCKGVSRFEQNYIGLEQNKKELEKKREILEAKFEKLKESAFEKAVNIRCKALGLLKMRSEKVLNNLRKEGVGVLHKFSKRVSGLTSVLDLSRVMENEIGDKIGFYEINQKAGDEKGLLSCRKMIDSPGSGFLFLTEG